MKKKKTAVNYLLVDASGSMECRKGATQEGLDSFVAKLQKEVSDSRLVVMFFSNTCEQKYAGLAKDCPRLLYATGGGTVLWGSRGNKGSCQRSDQGRKSQWR